VVQEIYISLHINHITLNQFVMKKLLLLSLICWVSISLGWSQTTVLDFEAAGTSTNFQYFGSSLDGSLAMPIANPDKSGINTSDSVMVHAKPGATNPGIQPWAGAFSNPNPSVQVDLVTNDRVCIKVWMPQLGSVALKFEEPTTGGANWADTLNNTVVNGWEELCFDVTKNSVENNDPPAFGRVFNKVVIFFEFQKVLMDSTVFYFDDIVLQPAPAAGPCNTVLDFETAATSTSFQYFGSSLEPGLSTPIANPDKSGDNTSDSVMVQAKPANSQPWAGFYTNPDPATAFDFTSNDQVCLKVWMPKLGSVAVKFENSATGDNWVDTVNNTVINQWEELCLDVTKNSIEGPNTPAFGHIYPRMVVFFEFQKVLTDSTLFYFDDVCVRSSGGAPDSTDVPFAVDMNSYTGTFTQPYVRGSFNGWGLDNPLSDGDGDGIWTTTLKLPNGAYEYKFNLDDAVWEEFESTDLCTVTDPSGAFVNRSITASSTTPADTFCFNSCYQCGDAVNITFRLGIYDGFTPDTSGVWLAGGGNFESPGSVYEMQDDGSGLEFSITVERQKGFSSYYTYANGNCPDFSCKEDINGQACADPNNFNDRFLPPVMSDTTLDECFQDCPCATRSIDDAFTPDLFQVMPTQVSSMVTVVFGEESRAVKQLEVLNLNGQVVLSRLMGIGEQQVELDLSHLPSGLYFVQGRSDEKFATQKILKY
jgi:hypothetical protein